MRSFDHGADASASDTITRRLKLKITKTLTLAVVLISVLTMAACDDEPKIPMTSMSCTELAREMGRFSQMAKDAEIDSAFHTIETILADDDDEALAATFNGITEDATASMARDELEALNRVYRQRGCR